MNEVDWFVSQLTPNEMILMGKLIPGFPSDTRVPALVKEKVIEALNNGYKKGSGKRYNKTLVMNIRDLYEKIGNDYIKKHPTAVEREFEHMVLKLSDARIRPYNKIAVLFTFFPTEFSSNLPKMIDNTVNKRNFLEGIGLPEGGEMSIPHKINRLLHGNQVEVFRTKLENLEANYMQVFVSQEKPELANEDDLWSTFKEASQHLKLPILLHYLISNKRYELPENLELVNTVLHWLSKYERSEMEQQIRKYEGVLRQLNNDLALQKDMNHLLREEQDKTRRSTTLFNEIQTLCLELLQGRKLVIITDRYVLPTLFDQSTFTQSYFLELGVDQWKDYKDCLFVITRNDFETSKQWISFTATLTQNHIAYVELTGYEELGHLAQIVNYLLTEEWSNDSRAAVTVG